VAVLPHHVDGDLVIFSLRSLSQWVVDFGGSEKFEDLGGVFLDQHFLQHLEEVLDYSLLLHQRKVGIVFVFRLQERMQAFIQGQTVGFKVLEREAQYVGLVGHNHTTVHGVIFSKQISMRYRAHHTVGRYAQADARTSHDRLDSVG
jgi:hypothetical protein